MKANEDSTTISEMHDKGPKLDAALREREREEWNRKKAASCVCVGKGQVSGKSIAGSEESARVRRDQ